MAIDTVRVVGSSLALTLRTQLDAFDGPFFATFSEPRQDLLKDLNRFATAYVPGGHRLAGTTLGIGGYSTDSGKCLYSLDDILVCHTDYYPNVSALGVPRGMTLSLVKAS